MEVKFVNVPVGSCVCVKERIGGDCNTPASKRCTWYIRNEGDPDEFNFVPATHLQILQVSSTGCIEYKGSARRETKVHKSTPVTIVGIDNVGIIS